MWSCIKLLISLVHTLHGQVKNFMIHFLSLIYALYLRINGEKILILENTEQSVIIALIAQFQFRFMDNRVPRKVLRSFEHFLLFSREVRKYSSCCILFLKNISDSVEYVQFRNFLYIAIRSQNNFHFIISTVYALAIEEQLRKAQSSQLR